MITKILGMYIKKEVEHVVKKILVGGQQKQQNKKKASITTSTCSKVQTKASKHLNYHGFWRGFNSWT